ncbi:DUF983 domain-containing protein [Allorhizobium sp. BGMRC 0089]|uniref:DUF983 domain-containing protein n=1 Tax=Allorhizobium sonneratiae TaxID=2934936 RepID=UPI0020344D8C|nr:DUF983 domain-containing protein [Allorhizobium sonneratiae]MCM2294493.1 DUF983 domain-containing protein [Allorhizobium sonneratiae]
MHGHADDYPPVPPMTAALSAACPRCGHGRLFNGLTKLKPACSVCGFDYTSMDPGDGAAIFVILIADFLVVGLALYTEVTYAPGLWVHFFIFGPLAVVLSLWLLRTIKALLIALQFKHNAHQGMIDRT